VKDVIDEIVDFIDGRYEGMKNLLETPENERLNTTREIQLMLGEIEIIKDCVNIIIKSKCDTYDRMGKKD
jgi:hypothetical protein